MPLHRGSMANESRSTSTRTGSSYEHQAITEQEEKIFPSWSNPHPPQHTEPLEYYIGDIYERYDALKDDRWPKYEPGDGPYVKRVKHLSRNGWPQLRYLADFLDCGTTPVKRKMLVPDDQSERKNRLHIVVMDVAPGMPLSINHFHTADELTRFLDSQPWSDAPGYVRLFVLEDLSSVSVELLGSRFDLDPGFFRSHISDYTWYNIRDPWFEMPVLPSKAAARHYFTIRHVRPHYFPDRDAATKAAAQVGGFNVLRRIDFDNPASTAWADKKGSSVGSIRSSTSCYIRPQSTTAQGWLGFLLVDPPIRVGYPLWGGYDNIRPPMPESEHDVLKPHLFKSPLEDFVYWMETTPAEDLAQIRLYHDLIISPIFCTIPSQWLLSFEHITNRLSLIEWTVERDTTRTADGLDEALRQLHPWRRNVVNFATRIRASIDMVEERFGNRTDGSGTQWSKYVANFQQLEGRCKTLEAKIDKIMSVLTAVISIEEGRQAVANNRDVSRITYLAFIYVPMGFVASFLSMNNNLMTGDNTVYWIFFVVAIPITAMSVYVAVFWLNILSFWRRAAKNRQMSGDSQ